MEQSEQPAPKEILLPPVDLHIVFGPHATAEHAQGLAEHIERSDIVIPELFGHSDIDQGILQSISQHVLTPERGGDLLGFHDDDRMRPFMEAFLKQLYASRKPVLLIDVPESDPIYQETMRLDETDLIASSFNQTLTHLKDLLDRKANLTSQRETYMIDHLLPALTVCINNNPDLGEKDCLRPLMFLGSNHTTLYHDLKQQIHDGTVSVSRTHLDPALVGTIHDEAIRRITMNKPVDNHMLARILLEKSLEPTQLAFQLHELTDDPSRVMAALSRIASYFPLDEIRSTYTQAYDLARGMPGFTQLMLGNLIAGDDETPGLVSQKNIRIPQTKDELVAFTKI